MYKRWRYSEILRKPNFPNTRKKQRNIKTTLTNKKKTTPITILYIYMYTSKWWNFYDKTKILLSKRLRCGLAFQFNLFRLCIHT